MCLAIPGKIISIDTAHELKMATVDFHGVRKEICIEWIDAGIGDYILAHACLLYTSFLPHRIYGRYDGKTFP